MKRRFTLAVLILSAALVVPLHIADTVNAQARQSLVPAYDCDPAPLVAIGREMIGPEKPRTWPPFPTTPTLKATPAPGFIAPCNLPAVICAAREEARVAAWRADVLARLRDEVVRLERCGY